jgi:predicted DCC family thiol-disulfide oxidoreductase YuxK
MSNKPDDPRYPLTVFFDGACPLCHAEMHLLRRRDVGGRLRFVDVAAPGFVPPAGAALPAMLAEIHALTADGRWLVGVDTLRATSAAVGRHRLAALLSLPGTHALWRRAYRGFARRRHGLSHRLAPLLVRAGLLPALALHGRCDADGCSL